MNSSILKVFDDANHLKTKSRSSWNCFSQAPLTPVSPNRHLEYKQQILLLCYSFPLIIEWIHVLHFKSMNLHIINQTTLLCFYSFWFCLFWCSSSDISWAGLQILNNSTICGNVYNLCPLSSRSVLGTRPSLRKLGAGKVG